MVEHCFTSKDFIEGRRAFMEKAQAGVWRDVKVASVELRGLTKRYGELAVVDDISLTIEHAAWYVCSGRRDAARPRRCG